MTTYLPIEWEVIIIKGIMRAYLNKSLNLYDCVFLQKMKDKHVVHEQKKQRAF